MLDRYEAHQLFKRIYRPPYRLFSVVDGVIIARNPDEPVPDAGRYTFSLDCNPTMCQPMPGTRGKRRAVHDPLAWLHRKGAQFGFRVDEVRRCERYAVRFVRKNAQCYIAAVIFEGDLTVLDPAQFARAYHDGLGSAKAFGFGMIRLTPLHVGSLQ